MRTMNESEIRHIRTEADRERARRIIAKAKDDYARYQGNEGNRKYLYWPILEELWRREPISGTEINWIIKKKRTWSEKINFSPEKPNHTGFAGADLKREGIIHKRGHAGWILTAEAKKILAEFM